MEHPSAGLFFTIKLSTRRTFTFSCSVMFLLVNISFCCFDRRVEAFSTVFVIFLLVNISTQSFCCFEPAGSSPEDQKQLFCFDRLVSACEEHVVLAPITHVCSMPHMFLARRLCSVKHYVWPLYNVYGAARVWQDRLPKKRDVICYFLMSSSEKTYLYC